MEVRRSAAWRLAFVGCAVVLLGSTCEEDGCGELACPTSLWWARLSGANEVPPVSSGATAAGTFTLVPRGPTGTDTLVYQIIIGTAFPGADTITQAHIHSPAQSNGTAGIAVWLCGSTVGGATPPLGPAGTPICPTGLGSGQSISGRAAITTAQRNSLRAFTTYANVHTKSNPDGEIRGQLRLPDP
jgi:CHRD domain-containing protein